MISSYFPLIYFFYGLAFFSMGLAITLELDHATDQSLRHAFRPLAVFGILHGFHEWIEMGEQLQVLPGQFTFPLVWEAIRLAILAFSFLSLAAFGVFLIFRDERQQRYSLLVPLGLVAIWGLGLLVMHNAYPLVPDLIYVANAWTRYVLAIPASLLAAAGLVIQQREFRRIGMAGFGRDCLWAAIAFIWYGLAGQTFPHASPLPPSDVINQELFLQVFGFPVQLLRAAAAIAAAFFIIRVLRSFEVENRRKIAQLQAARLEEAERREALRGEMLRNVVAAQETERQRIARELHDETGQALTAIGLGLRGVTGSLQQDGDKAGQNLRQLERLVDHSLVELQRLIADLRPSHLDDLGLGAALRWYASEIQNRAALNVSVSVIGEEPELPSEMKTALFRIAQEALNNVVKHANADNAQVRLTYGERGVILQVADDGVGFDSSRIHAYDRPSWGLVGMQERAKLVGGEFHLLSHSGVGTSVEVVLPYQVAMNGGNDGDTPVVG